MIIKNLATGEDVTKHYLDFLKGEINKEEFEKLSQLDSKNLKIKIDD